jgi:hypothetical protein
VDAEPTAGVGLPVALSATVDTRDLPMEKAPFGASHGVSWRREWLEGLDLSIPAPWQASRNGIGSLVDRSAPEARAEAATLRNCARHPPPRLLRVWGSRRRSEIARGRFCA